MNKVEGQTTPANQSPPPMQMRRLFMSPFALNYSHSHCHLCVCVFAFMCSGRRGQTCTQKKVCGQIEQQAIYIFSSAMLVPH